MIAKYLLPAIAVIGSAAAQCSSATATISSAAEATQLASCSTYKGSILVTSEAGQSVDISGIEKITGDLICENNGVITDFISTTLTSVGGSFTMTNVTILSNLQFTSLTSVGDISWTALNALDTLNFGTTGVTSAKTVVISDTFMSSLDGIDLLTVETLNINNNRRLTDFSSQLHNLSDILNIQANGLNMQVSLSNLTWIANMTIANVSMFDVPSLQVVNGSARFTSNFFTSFSAPNLTSTETGDISFVDNGDLRNISFPALTSIGGGLLIANNTDMDKVGGFPKLTTIFGAVKLRGNFTSVAFPDLNDVRGGFDVASTTDISKSCDTLKKLAPTVDGGGGQIQGTFNCVSDDTNANDDTSDNTTTGSGSGSGSGSSGDDNSASGLGINAAVLSLAIVGGIVALL